MRFPSGDYQRILAVANPCSTQAQRAQERLTQLSRLLPVTKIESSKHPAATEETVRKHAEAGDLLLGAGGDGLQRQIGNFMMSAIINNDPQLGTLTVLAQADGYANDHKQALNGRASTETIIREGRAVIFRPLEVTTTTPDGMTITSWALEDFGLGGTGQAAKRIETVKARSNRLTRIPVVALPRKAVASWQGVATYPKFLFCDSQNGETEFLTDYLAIRGGQIAKYGRPHAHALQPRFEAIKTRPRPDQATSGYVAVLADMLRMQRGSLYGTMLDSASFSVHTLTGNALNAHYDGEVEQIASGSSLTVAIAAQGYRTITTLPEAA